MPRTGQIIPRYLVPHVETYFNDNTSTNDIALSTSSENVARFLCVFPSAKGEDRVVKLMTNTADFIKEFGNVNFAKYGQANLMPYTLLQTGNAHCYCMRVTPEDATYAVSAITATVTNGSQTGTPEEVEEVTNVAVDKPTRIEVKNSTIDMATIKVYINDVEKENNVDYTVNTETRYVQFSDAVKEAIKANDVIKIIGTTVPEVVEGATSVEFKSHKIENITNKDDVLLKLQELKAENTYPLFAIVSKGRGDYGNSLSYRITYDEASGADNQYINYILTVYDRANGTLDLKEEFRGTFSPISVVNRQTLYLNDRVNDPINGSALIEIVINEDSTTGIDGLFEAIKAIAGENENITINTFDIFTGKNKAGALNAKYSVVSNSEGSVTFTELTGVSLEGGSDGAFTDESSLDDTYIKIFTGDNTISYDTSILSKRRTPCEFILDANYSTNVKKALVALARRRKDARLILDANKQTSVGNVVKYFEDLGIFSDYAGGNNATGTHIDDFVISNECQWYKTRDPFTGKVIEVTITHYLAQALPTHYVVNGEHIPFVGAQYSTLTNHIRRSVKPVIDADDLESKELLYTNRINFFESLAEDVYVHATQSTCNEKWTDMSEANNVDVILRMKRMLESFMSGMLYDFTDSEDRVRFTEDADRLFMNYPNTKLRSYEVFFDMNEYEQEKSILHCYLGVIFRSMGKRGIVEIDINKRATTTTV